MLKSMFTGPCYIDFKERENESELGDWKNERGSVVLGGLAMLSGLGGQCQPGGSMSNETAEARMARWAQGCGCEAPIAGHLPPCCSGGRCRRRHPPCARQGEGSLIIATNIRKNIKHRDRFDVIPQLKCNAT